MTVHVIGSRGTWGTWGEKWYGQYRSVQRRWPTPTVHWVLSTGSEGNMDAANEVCLLVGHWLPAHPGGGGLGAASATLVLQAWWWPGRSEHAIV